MKKVFKKVDTNNNSHPRHEIMPKKGVKISRLCTFKKGSFEENLDFWPLAFYSGNFCYKLYAILTPGARTKICSYNQGCLHYKLWFF